MPFALQLVKFIKSTVLPAISRPSILDQALNACKFVKNEHVNFFSSKKEAPFKNFKSI